VPRILPYEQRTSAQAPVGPGPGERPFSGSSVTAGIAQALGGVADDQLTLRTFEKQKAEERAAVQAHEQVTSARSRWIEELQKRQQDAPEDGAGFATSTLEAFDLDADERIKTMPTQASRDWLKQRLSDVRLGLQADALAFEAARGAEYKVNGLTRAIDQARTAAEFRPEEFSTLAAEQVAAIQASGLNAKAQAKLTQDALSMLADASVRGMVRSDPAAALKELNNEQTKNRAVRSLSFDQRQQLRNAAEAEIRRREIETRSAQAEARQALGERVRDATAAYRMGLEFDAPPARSDFIAALGADDGAKAFESFQKEQQLGTAIRTLATSSDAEQSELLAKFAPTGTAGAAEAAERYRVLVTRADDLQRQREADPAAYAARYNPRVQAAFAASQESPEAARAYATATIAEQQRLGVARPQILPKDVADSLAQSFYTQNGEQVAALIQTERQKWGQHWPQVFGELAAKKIPPAALAIGRGMAPGAATRLASVSATPMEELKKGVDVPAADVKSGVDAAMTDFMRTLDGVVGAENTYAGMRDAVERLAYSYLRQGKGTNESIEQAYSEVLGDHYAFHEVNGRSFRVPIERDVPGLEIGARRALSTVSADQLQAPIQTSTSTPEAAVADLKRAIQRRGYWVTSASGERGLALFLDGSPVLRKDGSVYEVMWDDLARDIADTRESVQQHEDDLLMREAQGLR
jgi:hypothetical protein